MPKKFFMLAGESSGDQHAARLIAALKAREPGARFIGMGGRLMMEQGLQIVKDLEGMQVTGFWEVARQYGFFKRVFYDLLDRVKQEKPDAVICIDYPGFNLRFAKEVHQLGIPILYYIVPQVWAWKAARAKSMARFVDRCFCIFEFEPPFFERYGLKTRFVGHPLVDLAESGTVGADSRRDAGAPTLQEARNCLGLEQGSKIVGLFPGSRENEIKHHLKPMIRALQLASQNNQNTIGWIALPPDAPKAWRVTIEQMSGITREQSSNPASGFHQNLVPVGYNLNQIKELEERGRRLPPCNLPALAAAADFSVVKSGTSTLEAGLAGKPMCVLYKGSAVSYAIAHLLVNIPVFSLVNIVLGRYAVPELLQGDVNPERIAIEIRRGLFDEHYRERQITALADLPNKLGGSGASDRTAMGILEFLN